MKEATENAVIVQAPSHPEVVLKLSKELQNSYKTGIALRKKANEAGLVIGRMILEACSDKEVIGRVLALNAKENKKTGGTHTKIYSWVCDRLAEVNGYNADYLKQCARNFLNATNRFREQSREEPLKLETGVFKQIVKAPSVEDVAPFVAHPPHPRMDDVCKEENATEPNPQDEDEIIEKKIDSVLSRFLLPDGTPRVNPKAFKTLVTKFQPVIEAHGFAIAKTSNQPVSKR